MASSFQVMMAEAKLKATDGQAGVEAAIRAKERKERERRLKQDEAERKEREIQAKIRERQMEHDKREQERKRKEEQQRKAAEAIRERREQEKRDAILHGNKGAKWPTSSGQKRSRSLDDDDEAPGGNFLTREEKRARKEAAMFRDPPKKSAPSTSRYSKAGSKLPGGAMNVLVDGTGGSPSNAFGGTTRERLAHMTGGLIKLNTVKRDTRTIEEIVNDLHQKKTMTGDEAKTFDDWFGDKKKAAAKTPSHGSNSGSQRNTPTSSTTPVTSSARKPAPTPSSSRPSASTVPSKPKQTSKSAPRPVPPPLSSSSAKSKVSSSSMSAGKKRPRSFSRSESPPPRQKIRPNEGASDVRNMVWEAMGFKGKNAMAVEVYSDDEDMEADAWSVQEEEAKSARIAKREEALALAEEKRREEEKRKRKMARQREEY